MDPTKILSVAQAAKLLNVTPGRVRHLLYEGRFAGAEQLGREWMIPRSAVESFERLPQGRQAGTKLPKKSSKSA